MWLFLSFWFHLSFILNEYFWIIFSWIQKFKSHQLQIVCEFEWMKFNTLCVVQCNCEYCVFGIFVIKSKWFQKGEEKEEEETEIKMTKHMKCVLQCWIQCITFSLLCVFCIHFECNFTIKKKKIFFFGEFLFVFQSLLSIWLLTLFPINFWWNSQINSIHSLWKFFNLKREDENKREKKKTR